MNFQIPDKAKVLFELLHRKIKYIVLYGGRGSAKSETTARYVIARCFSERVKVLCIRESQNSMTESVHSLLSSVIKVHNLSDFFEIQRDKIICIRTGSTVIFKGLRQEAGHIRSMHDVDIVWIEEGQYVQKPGFISLDDTIRKEGSVIIMCLNPRHALDHLYAEFVAQDRDDTLKIQLNILDNPFATSVSREKAARLKRTNEAAYRHIYLGELEEGGETIGAFRKIPKFTAEYLVAFIDTSFSDATDSDRTSLSIVGFAINEIDDPRQCPIEFTGASWQKGITNDQVISEMIDFLDIYQPIETCVENNLGGEGLADTFINRFKIEEIQKKLKVKNNWTTFHQSGLKHGRIMHGVGSNKSRIFVLEETDAEYLNPIMGYSKRVKHDDEIDSLAGAINLWLTSKSLRSYIYQFERLKARKKI